MGAIHKLQITSPSLIVAWRTSGCKLWHGVNCCRRERFWKAHAVRSAIEMDKYNTILLQEMTLPNINEKHVNEYW